MVMVRRIGRFFFEPVKLIIIFHAKGSKGKAKNAKEDIQSFAFFSKPLPS
jgi:hypothetical protein